MAVHDRASDLHLSAGLPPMQRLREGMCRLALLASSPDEVKMMLSAVMSKAQAEHFAQHLSILFNQDLISEKEMHRKVIN